MEGILSKLPRCPVSRTTIGKFITNKLIRDYALYNASLKVATNGTYIPSISKDYPLILYIGPSYYESFNTWPDTKFIYGFNLAKNTTEASESISNSVPQACKALSNGNLLYWEMGNEPDLFKTSAQGITRPKSWDEADYVNEWMNKTNMVKDLLAKNCDQSFVSSSSFRWIAPSFAGTNNSLNATKTWQAGLGKEKDIALFSSHK